MSRPSLVSPYGYSASTCGYCAPSGSRSTRESSLKYGFEGPQMTVQPFYQNLIDRGWRRSGDFVYHPDMARTCCPQYTIRCDARAFKPDKKHRAVINRFNRFLETGSKDLDVASKDSQPGAGSSGSKASTSDTAAGSQGQGGNGGKAKGKGKAGPYDWMAELHKWEANVGSTGKRKFQLELVPAKSTPETYDLYKRYQVAVHNDPPDKMTQRGFRRFLCDSPLLDEPIPYSTPLPTTSPLPRQYGSYHLLYKVDDQFIGISVIDILPICVSSVYFIWDPEWAWASLGKLSALWEASLARRIWEARGGLEGEGDGGWVYMGYWIANCQKMRYKSEYSPSYLLDPGTNHFHPLTPTLDKFLRAHPQGYYPFITIPSVATDPDPDPIIPIDQTTSSNDADDEIQLAGFLPYPDPPPPGSLDPNTITAQELDRVMVVLRGGRDRVVKLGALQFNNEVGGKRTIRELIAALGRDMIAVAEGGMAGIKDRALVSL